MTRRGVTTVELILVLTIAGLLSAAIGTLLRRQQRFYMRAASIVEHRASLREATAILPAELRALSPGSGDVLAFSDSALEIRSTIGAGIVCDLAPDAMGIDVSPASRTAPATLAAFSTAPQAGDIALVYDSGLPDDSTDDGWIARSVQSVAPVVEACATTPIVPADLALLAKLRLRFGGAALPATIQSGAFVHVLRRVRYRLYRSSTADWYLGYSEWNGAAYSVVQPVSGPFAAYSTRVSSTGLSLRYFDADGVEVFPGADVSRVTRVEVAARAARAGGFSPEADSLRDAQDVTVRVRNR